MPKKKTTIDDIIHFSVGVADGKEDIQLIDFFCCLQACSEFMNGFLEYAKKHPKEEITDFVLGGMCDALSEFNGSVESFNMYLKGRVSDWIKNPDIQQLITHKNIKPNTIKS